MHRFRHIHVLPALLLIAALLMRAAIPAGYMPATVGSGGLFMLCPEGTTGELLRLLVADSGQHDHHHHPVGDSETGKDTHRCPFATLFLLAVAGDAIAQPVNQAVAALPVAAAICSFQSALRANYHSRAPPA